jgi:hypothetical protein
VLVKEDTDTTEVWEKEKEKEDTDTTEVWEKEKVKEDTDITEVWEKGKVKANANESHLLVICWSRRLCTNTV